MENQQKPVAQVIELPSIRFKDLDGAQEYVNRFEIVDKVRPFGEMGFENGLMQLDGKEFQFGGLGWNQFLSSVAPGASRFINGGVCPNDLAQDIVNRMLREKKDEEMMVRVERDDLGRNYVKAVLSPKYRSYNNQQFIKYLKENNPNEGIALRPAIFGGQFNVNYINPKKEIQLDDRGNNRVINIGANFKNGEDGSAAISVNPFVFDGFCQNGAIFGKRFLENVGKRIVHRGDELENRVAGLVMNADDSMLKKLRASFINMQNVMMSLMYWERIAKQAVYPMGLVSQKVFGEAIPFQQEENRFDFYNRVNRYAHVGNHDEEMRGKFERLAGMIVEENLMK